MKINAYSGSMRESLEIEDSLVIGYAVQDDSTAHEPFTLEMIEQAIDRPVGKERIEESVGPDTSVAIIVDDATRPTPTSAILPIVLKKLYRAGVTKEHICITIGTGLHRDTTVEEKKKILGEAIYEEFDVIDNAGRDNTQFTYVGTNSYGLDININNRVADADYVITIGMVKSHAFAGFTGGAKSILPAVSNQSTVHGNHCFDNIEYPQGILGSCDRSVARLGMEEAARFVDPYIINVVLDKQGNVVHLSAGDVVFAHRKAVAFYMGDSEKLLDTTADIAIIYGGLAGSINLYQGLFGCNVVKTTERPILQKGGTAIIYAECAQGLGTHLFEEMMPKFDTPAEVLAHLKSHPVIDDQWAVQFLCSFLEDLDIYLVSSTISDETAEVLRIKPFKTLEEALKQATAKYEKPKVAIIENPDGLIVNLREA